MLWLMFTVIFHLNASVFLSNATSHSIECLVMLQKIREMFNFGYSNYMNYAYPKDELNPIYCRGRGYDHDDRSNINVNDALGDYQLTLVDSLDSLAIFGNISEFKRAVNLVTQTLSFNQPTIVQIFEANIRILGGLLSAHLLITDPDKRLGDLRPDNYNDELLDLARDLCERLKIAFRGTPTGIPFPRVHLQWRSVETLGRADTCVAGAGSLLLEMGSLSLLLGDAEYATLARKAVLNLWNHRSPHTGLLGTSINVYTGDWINTMSGLGAGQDSFYEYLLKSGILFNDAELMQMFRESLRNLRQRVCNNASAHDCLCPDGGYPVYWNTDMRNGGVLNYWVDALQSVWPAVLVLAGELEDAKCQHQLHTAIWERFGLPPERFNLAMNQTELDFYPLRPEFAESTYYLYRATKDPIYRRIGALIVNNLNRYARAKCGFATIHNVQDMSQEDRMESFFLSETLKYLYLLFDESHPLNVYEEDYIFTTQAHVLPITRLRKLMATLPNNPFQNQPYIFHAASGMMGSFDFNEASGDTGTVPTGGRMRNVTFFVGETRPRRQIPIALARRLSTFPVRTIGLEERYRRSEERVKKLKTERLRKIHEHNERVRRIALKRRRERLENADGGPQQAATPSH